MTNNPTLENNIKSKISTTSSQGKMLLPILNPMIIGISPLFLLLACYITAYCASCTGWMLSQLWLEQYTL